MRAVRREIERRRYRDLRPADDGSLSDTPWVKGLAGATSSSLRAGRPVREAASLHEAGPDPSSGQPRPRQGTGSPQRRAAQVILALFDLGGVVCALVLFGRPGPAAWVYAAAVLVSLAASGAHHLRIRLQLLNEVPFIVRRLAVPALLLLPFTVGSPTPWRLCLQAAATTLAVCLARGASYGLIRSLRRRGRLVEPTVIVGVGEVGMQVESLIEEHPEYGLQVVGFVDSMPDGVRLARPLLGEVQDLETVLRRFEVHRVIIAFGYVAEANWVSVLRTAVLKGVEVHVIPRFFDVGMATGGIGVDEIWGIPLWRVRRSALRTTAWRAKRVFDVAVSASALMVLFPVVAVLAAMVRLTSPGPVLFRQTRVGQNGQLFELLKFRSMRVDHDGNSWHAPDDELTRIGGFLRGTSLDELPQFWNVLKGDMSLVGPRPERPIFAERFSADIPGYVDRHRVAVGLTGWAQINGLRGNGTSLPERARFDNVYIEGWSLWFDLVILVRTFGSLVEDAIRWTRRQQREAR